MNALSLSLAGLLVGVALSPTDVFASGTDAIADPNANANTDAIADPNANANTESVLDRASLEEQAGKLEAKGAFTSSARAWEKLFLGADEQATRVNAAYQSQRVFRKAAVAANSPEPLCRALDVVHGLLAGDDLTASDREDFTNLALELEAILVVSFNQTCPIEQPKPDLLPIGHQQNSAPPSPTDSEPAAPRFTKKRGIALLAGSTLVTAGVGLLALGTYGLVEGSR
ncbi:MAG TPA: hypothetical protein ENJ18_14735, partial [Nannocystis exedens]|nr:hypothetical protein [Nannocystis exedens]